jgi:hypothetical protein
LMQVVAAEAKSGGPRFIHEDSLRRSCLFASYSSPIFKLRTSDKALLLV